MQLPQWHLNKSFSSEWSWFAPDAISQQHWGQNVSQKPLWFIFLRVRQNKPGLTWLAGDLSYALALRDALILVDRNVWTVCCDGWVDKADCHAALVLLGLADSSLAWRGGGYLPATALYRENMNTHVRFRRRCRCTHSHGGACKPRSMTIFTSTTLYTLLCPSFVSPFLSISGQANESNQTYTHKLVDMLS